MIDDLMTKSTLTAKTTAEVDEQIQEELSIPDPQKDKAMATLTGEEIDEVKKDKKDDEESSEEEEDEDGGN